MRAVEVARNAVAGAVRPGDAAIDATCGNGHDTLFLAAAVGPAGRVIAMDVQPLALAKTAARLAAAGVENVTLLSHDHRGLADAVPRDLCGRVGAVMFNLGYLPGADHSVTTSAAGTAAAVAAALRLVRVGGVVTVVAYTGHPGGVEEADAVSEVMVGSAADGFAVRTTRAPGKTNAPVVFAAARVR